MTSIKDRLIELKNQRGYLQKEIADGIGIPLRTYQRYEYGEREPNASVIVSLADFFEVSTDYLLGRTDNTEVNQ